MTTEQDRYQIRVQGWIAERWAYWFDGMTIIYEGEDDVSAITILSGPVVDQVAFQGRSFPTSSRVWPGRGSPS